MFCSWISHYAKLDTDLARHYRCKEELSTQAKGEDFIGDSLEGFTVVHRPLQFQHSPITWKRTNTLFY